MLDKTRTNELVKDDQLIDRYQRSIRYLRLSVTDRCDLRCIYCMDEDMQFVKRSELLSFEEIIKIAIQFVDLGVEKIRLTGGEPLVRKNILELCRALKFDAGVENLCMTSNGTLLDRYAKPLVEAGMQSVNISLDTLNPERYATITRGADIQKVLTGINASLEAGFDKVKINAVVMKSVNDDEVPALVDYAAKLGVDITFIEEMPLGDIKGRFRGAEYCSSDEVRRALEARFTLHPIKASATGGPANSFAVEGTNTRVGFISPHSHNFCDQCNRVRMTATGRLLLCLGQENSVDLKQLVRDHPLDPQPLRQAIINSMQIKPKGHDFNVHEQPIIMRHMNVTGG